MKNNGNKISNPVLPATLYDVNTKKVVGIFKTKTLVAKYIFAEAHNCQSITRITASISKKVRIKSDGLLLTVRTANPEQVLILGDRDFIILNGYKEPRNTDMKII
jgi:hypothetical protein